MYLFIELIMTYIPTLNLSEYESNFTAFESECNYLTFSDY